MDVRHNGPVLGPAKPEPSAGHDELKSAVTSYQLPLAVRPGMTLRCYERNSAK
jgi:hypothetical protein